MGQPGRKLTAKVMDFNTFMDKIARLEEGSLAISKTEFENETETGSITYHNFCQSGNILGLGEEPRRLIRALGIELNEMEESNVCCGFGGSTSADYPEVSRRILERKFENVERSGAKTLVTDNPGCIMHMRGGAHAQKRPWQVLHIAELVADQMRRFEAFQG